MTNVIHIDFRRSEPRFAVMCLCLTCMHRWVGSVLVGTNLFKLECPHCGAFDSFASFMPSEYFDLLGD